MRTILISLLSLLIFVGCLSEAEQVPETSSDPLPVGAEAGAEVDQFALHEPRTECALCHESARLVSDTHPPEGDCYACHRYPSWDLSESSP